MSLMRLHELARTYQAEHEELATHEAVHDDRIALLSLLDLTQRHQAARDEAPRAGIEQRLAALTASAQQCMVCHHDSAAEQAFTLEIGRLREAVAHVLAAPAAVEGSTR